LAAVRDRGVSLTLLSDAQREFVSTMDTLAKSPDEAVRPSRDVLQNLSFDPPELTDETMGAVRQVSAPVFDKEGRVVLVLTAFGFGRPASGVDGLTAALLDIAAAATRRNEGHAPQRRAEQ
jgi:hypothetical protein